MTDKASRFTAMSVIVGLLSFLGALAGTYFSSLLEEHRESKKQQREWRVKIVEKRLSVIEKCATARSLVGRARTLLRFREVENRKLSKLPKDAYAEWVPKVFTHEMQKEFADLQSMHLACVDMGSLIFGPKSRKAAEDVFANPSDWIPDENNPYLAKLYEALVSEVQYFGDGKQ